MTKDVEASLNNNELKNKRLKMQGNYYSKLKMIGKISESFNEINV